MEVFKQVGEKSANGWGQVIALVLQNTREVQLEDAGPLADRDAILKAERPHLAN